MNKREFELSSTLGGKYKKGHIQKTSGFRLGLQS
jgi:hypothetical protein